LLALQGSDVRDQRESANKLDCEKQTEKRNGASRGGKGDERDHTYTDWARRRPPHLKRYRKLRKNCRRKGRVREKTVGRIVFLHKTA